MAHKCYATVVVNHEIIPCYGNITEVVYEENGNLVIEDVCVKCGKTHSLQPFIVSKSVQMIIPGLYLSEPLQTVLF